MTLCYRFRQSSSSLRWRDQVVTAITSIFKRGPANVFRLFLLEPNFEQAYRDLWKREGPVTPGNMVKQFLFHEGILKV